GLFQPIKNNYWSKRMQAGHLGKALCLTALAAVSGLLWAQTSYEPPRTEWGVPDLQGNWSIATQTTLERPDRYNGKLVLTEEEAQAFEAAVQARNQAANAPSDPSREPPREGINVGGYNNFWMDPGERLIRVNGEIRTSIMIDPPDGKLPYNDTGRANHQTTMAIREGYDGPEVRPMGERCLVGFGSTAGPPKLPVSYNNNTQIIQNKDYVVLLAEMNHDARIVRLGKSFREPPTYDWLGDSIGYYEGDTLVVETTHFHPQQSFRSSLTHRFYASSDMHVVERFTRVSDEVIQYEFTVTDPENYTQPWSGIMPMNKTDDPLFEYACHEGNYAMPGILAGARRAEADGVPYAPTYSF
ncbi:MAG: hypothetical protein Q8L06_01680, partial [Pseudohongiella sp.]|nr:hypothetical protein [Pseudohongiella sp.]